MTQEAKARELLAAQYESFGRHLRAAWLRSNRTAKFTGEDRAALHAIQTAMAQEREEERAATVAWLREQPSLVPISTDHVRTNAPSYLASAIESGSHLPRKKEVGDQPDGGRTGSGA